jgi:hypothetical protein
VVPLKELKEGGLFPALQRSATNGQRVYSNI